MRRNRNKVIFSCLQKQEENGVSQITREKQECDCIKLYQQSLNYHSKENFQSALKGYLKLLKHPLIFYSFHSVDRNGKQSEIEKNPFLYLKYLCLKNIGLIYIECNMINDAIMFLKDAYLIEKSDSSLLYKLGKLSFDVKDYSFARKVIEELLMKNEENKLGYELLLEILYRIGDFLCCKKIGKKILQNIPMNFRAKTVLRKIKNNEFFVDEEDRESSNLQTSTIMINDFKKDRIEIIYIHKIMNWENLLIQLIKEYNNNLHIISEKIVILKKSNDDQNDKNNSNNHNSKMDKFFGEFEFNEKMKITEINVKKYFKQAVKRKRPDDKSKDDDDYKDVIEIDDDSDNSVVVGKTKKKKKRKVVVKEVKIVGYLRGTFLEDKKNDEKEGKSKDDNKDKDNDEKMKDVEEKDNKKKDDDKVIDLTGSEDNKKDEDVVIKEKNEEPNSTTTTVEENTIEKMKFLIDERIDVFLRKNNRKVGLLEMMYNSIKFLLENYYNQIKWSEKVKSLVRKISLILIDNHFYKFDLLNELYLCELYFDKYLASPYKNKLKLIFCRRFLNSFENDYYCSNEENKERLKENTRNEKFLIRKNWLKGLVHENFFPELALKYFEDCLKLIKSNETEENDIEIVNSELNNKINIENVENKVKELDVSSKFNHVKVLSRRNQIIEVVTLILELLEGKTSKGIREKLRNYLLASLFKVRNCDNQIFHGDNTIKIIYHLFLDFELTKNDSIQTITKFMSRIMEFIFKVGRKVDRSDETFEKRKYVLDKVLYCIGYLEEYPTKSKEISHCIGICFIILYHLGSCKQKIEKFIHCRNIRIYLSFHYKERIEKIPMFFNFLIKENWNLYQFYKKEMIDDVEMIPPTNNVNLIVMRKELFTLFHLAYCIKLFNERDSRTKDINALSISGKTLQLREYPEIATICFSLLIPFIESLKTRKRKLNLVNQIRIILTKIYSGFKSLPNEIHQIKEKILQVEKGGHLDVSEIEIPDVKLDEIIPKPYVQLFSQLFFKLGEFDGKRAAIDSVELYENEKYCLSIYLLRKACSCTPKNPVIWLKLALGYSRLSESLFNSLDIIKKCKKVVFEGERRFHLRLENENVSYNNDLREIISRSIRCFKVVIQLISKDNKADKKLKKKSKLSRFEISRLLYRLYKLNKISGMSDNDIIVKALVENIESVSRKQWNDHYLKARIREYEGKVNPKVYINSYVDAFKRCEKETIESGSSEALPYLADCFYRFHSALLKLLLTERTTYIKLAKDRSIEITIKLVSAPTLSFHNRIKKIVKNIKKVVTEDDSNIDIWYKLYDAFLFCLRIHTTNFRAVYKLAFLLAEGPWKNWELAQKILMVLFEVKKKTSMKPTSLEFNIFEDPSIPVNRKLTMRKWQRRIICYLLKIIENTQDINTLRLVCSTLRRGFVRTYTFGPDLYKDALKIYFELIKNDVDDKKFILNVLEVFVYVNDGYLKNEFELIKEVKEIKDKLVIHHNIKELMKPSTSQVRGAIKYCKEKLKVDLSKVKQSSNIIKKNKIYHQQKLFFPPKKSKKKKKKKEKKKKEKKEKKKKGKKKKSKKRNVVKVKPKQRKPSPQQPKSDTVPVNTYPYASYFAQQPQQPIPFFPYSNFVNVAQPLNFAHLQQISQKTQQTQQLFLQQQQFLQRQQQQQQQQILLQRQQQLFRNAMRQQAQIQPLPQIQTQPQIQQQSPSTMGFKLALPENFQPRFVFKKQNIPMLNQNEVPVSDLIQHNREKNKENYQNLLQQAQKRLSSGNNINNNNKPSNNQQ